MFSVDPSDILVVRFERPAYMGGGSFEWGGQEAHSIVESANLADLDAEDRYVLGIQTGALFVRVNGVEHVFDLLGEAILQSQSEGVCVTVSEEFLDRLPKYKLDL